MDDQAPDVPLGLQRSAVPSLRANVVANYASQAYVVFAGILMMPFYLQRMGAEAYGLIGFFTLMVAWFQILDAGLSLTLSRECARYRARVIDAPTLRALAATLEIFFACVAVVAGLAILATAHLIAGSWLRAQHLPIAVVTHAVLLMGLTVPLQWMTGLYRGAIIGFERQVWLAGFNVAMASLRFGGGAAAITLLGPTPWNFFCFQLGVSILELAALIIMGGRVLPPIDATKRRILRWREVRDLLRFSGSLAIAVVAWVAVTQVDKLVLSKLLSLSEYGLYTLAVIAAGGILALGGPISQAMLPRLARLTAEGAQANVVGLYKKATQFVCLIAVPCAMLLAVFAGPVIWTWTGDARVAAAAGPILAAYALGNGVLTLSAFPYYLQYARGDLRLHVVGSLLLIGFFIPALVLTVSRFGAVGAGYAWLGMNTVYLLAWTPWVHARLVPGLHWRWLLLDILPIAGAVSLAAWLLKITVVLPHSRLGDGICLVGLGSALVGVGAIASPTARHWVSTTILRWSPLGRRA